MVEHIRHVGKHKGVGLGHLIDMSGQEFFLFLFIKL